MIALVEGAKRQKTPNEIALNILLASLTVIFMLAVITLQPMAFYAKAPQSLVVLVALLVALIPTTIGALLSAIGIAGMDRLVQRNVLAMSGRAVEAAGRRQHAAAGQDRHDHHRQPAGVGVPARQRGQRRRAGRRGPAVQPGRLHPGGPLHRGPGQERLRPAGARGGRAGRRGVRRVHRADPDEWRGPGRRPGQVRKGAAASVAQWIRDNGGTPPADLQQMVDDISAVGGTPLVVAEEPGEARPGGAWPGAGAGRHPPQGHRQGRHRRALRRDAQDGHPDRHDHRGQPADGQGHRRGVRRGRLPGRGHARGQDGPDQEGAGGRQARRDDRRRHQRRARRWPRPTSGWP